jgi:hypothetical protein
LSSLSLYLPGQEPVSSVRGGRPNDGSTGSNNSARPGAANCDGAATKSQAHIAAPLSSVQAIHQRAYRKASDDRQLSVVQIPDIDLRHPISLPIVWHPARVAIDVRGSGRHLPLMSETHSCAAEPLASDAAKRRDRLLVWLLLSKLLETLGRKKGRRGSAGRLPGLSGGDRHTAGRVPPGKRDVLPAFGSAGQSPQECGHALRELPGQYSQELPDLPALRRGYTGEMTTITSSAARQATPSPSARSNRAPG